MSVSSDYYGHIAGEIADAGRAEWTPPPPECPVTGWPQIDRDDLDMCSCGHRHIRIEAWGGGGNDD